MCNYNAQLIICGVMCYIEYDITVLLMTFTMVNGPCQGR